MDGKAFNFDGSESNSGMAPKATTAELVQPLRRRNNSIFL